MARTTKSNALLFLLRSLLAAVCVLLFSLTGLTATYTVTNNNDAGAGSFRQAIIDANNTAASGPHTIVFNLPAGEVINLLTGMPAVNTNVTIVGPTEKITIRRSSSASAEFRLFQISGNRMVVMKNLILESGAPASGQSGGGLYVQGMLEMENCIVRNCKTYGGAGIHGGAIWNEGSLTLRSCQINNNTATGWGGAIIVRSNARFYMANSSVENNTAGGNGGGISHDANSTAFTNTIINSIIRNNTGTSGNGGGINNNARLEVINTLVSGNSCGARGGGIGNEGSNNVNLLLRGCTINNNTAASNGGGVHFYTSAGTYSITNCTISSNRCTGSGGGLHTQAGGGIINNSTVVLNNSSGNGGGLRFANGINELNYTIVAGNNATNTDVRGRDMDGNRFSSFGRNLIGTAGSTPYGSWTAGSVTTGNNITNIDVTAILNTALADNGGPLPTHALLAGSFAVNPAQAAGLNAPFDQRGFPRAGTVDVGAFEFNSTAPTITTGAATNIRATSVVLNGTASTGGLPVSYSFDYGTTATYGLQTAVQTTAGGNVGIIATAGLQPSATYQYRTKATYGSSNEFVLLGSNNSFAMPMYNAPPALTFATANLLLYTSVTDRITLDGNTGITDADNTTLAGATVRIAGNYINGEDEIVYTPVSAIEASWDVATGTMTFTGTAPVASYEGLLRSVQYKNSKGTAANYQQRTITVAIDDGLNEVSVSRNIVLALSENSPLLVSNNNTAFVYTEATGYRIIPVALSVSSPVATTLEMASVSITENYQPAEDELFFTAQNGISSVWNSSTGVLQLSGTATVAQYQTALNNIQYRNNSRNPVVLNRTVTYMVSDGANESNPFTKLISLKGVNDAPELSGIETVTLSHPENGAPLPLTASLVLFDADNTNLTGATVRISGNYKAGQDVLSFQNGNGITGNWTAATGTLALSGTATMAQYQSAIRSITYHQLTNYDWSGLIRTVSLTVTDGASNSNTVTRSITPQQKQMVTFNYAEGLQKTLYFLEAQRSGVLPSVRGKLPGQNRVEWRGNSLLTDGSDVGLDLTGGWYDAGDTYKTNSSMAYAAAMLAWSGIEYKQAYEQNGQQGYLLDNLKFINDYFIKCFVNDQPGQYKYYTQVTARPVAHSHWASPEVLDNMTAYLGLNASYRIDVDCKGSDAAGQAAAAMASSSIVFRKAGQIEYANLLLQKARSMFDFGDTYRGVDGHRNKNGVITKTENYFYRDNNYWDEMMWAAIWLHNAEQEAGTAGYTNAYLNKANEYYSLQPDQNNTFAHFRELSFAAVDKAAFVLLVKATSGAQQAIYRQRVENWLDWWTIGYTDKARYTAGGMACKTTQTNIAYAPLRYSTNQAFVAGIYSDWMPDGTGVNGPSAPLANPVALTSVNRKVVYDQFAQWQVNYAIGDNPYNRSYIVGYGPNPWNAPHHRAAYGPWAGFEHLIAGKPEFNPTKPRHTIYGALLGGPGKTDGAFTPLDEFDLSVNNVSNSVTNEVALDFNAGLAGALARLHLKYPESGSVMEDFPAAETRDDEFFAEAAVTNTTTNSVSVKVQINNRSSWPARPSDKLSARYFIRLESGVQPAQVMVQAQHGVPNTNTFGGTVSGLKRFHGNIYYVEIDFTGWPIYPGGIVPSTNTTDNVLWLREANFTLTGPSGWNNGNDWSYAGLAPLHTGTVEKAAQIPVYEAGQLLFGQEPDWCTAGEVSAGENRTVCAGTTITLNGSTPPAAMPAFTGTWTIVSGGSGSFGNKHLPNSSFTPGSPGNYILRWTIANEDCDEGAADVELKVVELAQPSINVSKTNNTFTGAGTAKIIFLGYGAQSITLTASNSNGAVSYQWSPAAGLSTTTGSTTVFTPTAAGVFTFTVTATNNDGCTAAATEIITVVDARCEKGKVFICHRDDKGRNAICIDAASVPDHLAHGCTIGACANNQFKTSSQNGTAVEVKEAPLSEAVKAFPNPASHYVMIDLSAMADQRLDLRLVQADGRVVQLEVLIKAGQPVHKFVFAQPWAAGQYLLQVQGTKQSATLKVVIVRD